VLVYQEPSLGVSRAPFMTKYKLRDTISLESEAFDLHLLQYVPLGRRYPINSFAVSNIQLL